MPQRIYMVRGPLLLVMVWVAVQCIVPTYVGAYLIDNWWNDGDNIVMDDVFLPAATWSSPAQFQLSEWNEVDTTDNSHPFRINSSPELSFGANDGDSTMGFLGEAGLNSEYGLSYTDALAWAVCWTGFFSGRIDECDMMLNPALAWQLVPDANNFFQSTVLHEAGHIRGLDHYNNYLSMQNSGTDKILRGEVLYMDDKVAVRQNASNVPESDIVIYNKFHNGSVPLWMTVSPTTARVGQTINFSNITVENRGTTAFGALRFGIYFSSNSIISTGDQLLNTGSYGSFGTFTFNTFNWSAGVPFVSDCGTYYFGAIIDDNSVYSERFEGNNATVFVNGTPTPQAFSILLERDAQEPNDSFAAPRTISLPFSSSSLTIDQDAEHDYYRFTLSQLSRVNIALAFTHAAGDIDMDLRNSSNVVLQSSTGTGNSESIVSDLAAGTYYIHTYGHSAAGSCNRYTMTATAAPLLPDINMLPSSWNYGNITVGSGGNKVFIVQNLGSGTLDVTSTSLVGTDSAHFAIISGGGAFTLAPTATQTVTVRFAPTSSGAKSATLRFVSNDPDENPQDAALSGIGTDAADLIVSSLAVPEARGAGDTLVVADTTTSLGGASAASTTRFVLSTDNLFNAGDIRLGGRAIAALSAGGSSAGKTSVIIPAGTAVGKYFVIARADANGVITETNEGNNNTARPIWIGPDLIVLKLTGPRSAVAGSTITVSDTTRNLGGDPVVATKTRYFLSTDDVLQPGDVILGARSVPVLAAKTSNSGAISVTIPAATAPGAYFLIAKADASRVGDESREQNNTRSRPITISSKALLTTGAHQ